MYKVTIVGAGHAPPTTAQRIVDASLADVVLFDVIEGMPQGKALDILQAGPIGGYDCKVVGTGNWVATQGSDVVVVTAGFARKPGMSRDDLAARNAAIVRAVVEDAVRMSPDAILLIVTNPLDAMAQVALRASRLPKQRVIGMAGVLDAARFRTFIAAALEVSVDSTHGFVLGGHGDEMVPLARYSTVAGIPLPELLSAEAIRRLVDRTRKGGAEIVGLLKTGSAYYAPAAAIVEMIQSILRDRKQVLPCAAYLQGEYGIDDLFFGVPAKLGAGGVEQIFEVALTEAERAAVARSAAAVRQLVGQLGV